MQAPKAFISREREVALRVARGLSSKQIARELDISDKAVQVRRAHILEELDVHSAAELAHRLAAADPARGDRRPCRSGRLPMPLRRRRQCCSPSRVKNGARRPIKSTVVDNRCSVPTANSGRRGCPVEDEAVQMTLPAVTLIAAVLVAGCQSTPTAGGGYITNGADLVKAADWSRMRTVTVTMDEHTYEPQVLRLEAGQPYKIELKNSGDKDHYYTAPEFFRSVAWRKLMVNKHAEIKVDYVTATEVLKKGGQLDLYVIPVSRGSYPVVCTIDDHREKGMEGRIVVE